MCRWGIRQIHSNQNVIVFAVINLFLKYQIYVEFPKRFASGLVLTSKINHGSTNPCSHKLRISGWQVHEIKNVFLTIRSVRIVNSTFERVEEFKHLGTTLTNQNSIAEEIKNRLRSGNAYYHSVQNLLSSRLLSKNWKIYRTIILPVICMGVKLGRWHCGRKGSWGCLITWCWGEYLYLRGKR